MAVLRGVALRCVWVTSNHTTVSVVAVKEGTGGFRLAREQLSSPGRSWGWSLERRWVPRTHPGQHSDDVLVILE
jgi:hypothetical protein